MLRGTVPGPTALSASPSLAWMRTCSCRLYVTRTRTFTRFVVIAFGFGRNTGPMKRAVQQV
jgi:hypothetical protein